MDGKLRNMTSLYLLRDERVLLLYRVGSRVVNNTYVGTAGGHFEPDELNDAKACVLRELQEECGLGEEDITNLSLRYITLRRMDGEIRQNYYFFADWNAGEKEITSNEGSLEWHDLQELSELEMPYSAKYVMKHFVEIGRNTSALYAGIATEQGVTFCELSTDTQRI